MEERIIQLEKEVERLNQQIYVLYSVFYSLEDADSFDDFKKRRKEIREQSDRVITK